MNMGPERNGGAGNPQGPVALEGAEPAVVGPQALDLKRLDQGSTPGVEHAKDFIPSVKGDQCFVEG
jgi:hypothetical protein